MSRHGVCVLGLMLLGLGGLSPFTASAEDEPELQRDAQPLNARAPTWPAGLELDEPLEVTVAVDVSPFGNVIDLRMTSGLPEDLVAYLSSRVVGWRFLPPQAEEGPVSQTLSTQLVFDPDAEQVSMEEWRMEDAEEAPNPRHSCDDWIHQNIPVLRGSLPDAYLSPEKLVEEPSVEWPQGVGQDWVGLVVMMVPPQGYEIEEDRYLVPERDAIAVTWAEPGDVFIETAVDALSEVRLDGGEAPEDLVSQPFCHALQITPDAAEPPEESAE